MKAFCGHDGHIGGLGYWYPEAAWIRDWAAPHPRVLCNHLACRACGQTVRKVDGARLPVGDLARVALRPGDELEAALALTPHGPSRTYACGCRAVTLTEVLALEPTPDERRHELPWSCQGHPWLMLPALVDGVDLRADRLEAVVDGALTDAAPTGFSPPGVAAHRHPSVWLAHVVATLEDRSLAARIGELTAARLDDPDAKVRRAAINLFRLVPGLAGFPRLGEMLESHRSAFDGVTVATARDLGHELRECIEWQLRSGSHAALERAIRADLLAGRGTAGMLFHLGRTDRSFLTTHAPALEAGRLGAHLVREALAQS